jgi:hypothetical protein
MIIHVSLVCPLETIPCYTITVLIATTYIFRTEAPTRLDCTIPYCTTGVSLYRNVPRIRCKGVHGSSKCFSIRCKGVHGSSKCFSYCRSSRVRECPVKACTQSDIGVTVGMDILRLPRNGKVFRRKLDCRWIIGIHYIGLP